MVGKPSNLLHDHLESPLLVWTLDEADHLVIRGFLPPVALNIKREKGRDIIWRPLGRIIGSGISLAVPFDFRRDLDRKPVAKLDETAVLDNPTVPTVCYACLNVYGTSLTSGSGEGAGRTL
ncbi:hypothetical protein CIHG_06034 [Coccidioides immitis H538.4]|uniref:Uncharacterized protein n=2 Tax=Coccidioides immitis TaxID=5501 RepID=A0A0J8QYC4_COCIT|nr:hypothetical protein CISG_01112 [Coccidioides immitis RMSCC 3703]KMU87641.1 hypothetical protein CIHG_06034 [Coccidioides immitis H538.4]